MTHPSILDELSGSRHVSLTTYRRDGSGVATPVWHAVDGDELFIWTAADSWKVKRIRNNSRVVVTACDRRGRIQPDAPTAAGTARLLNESDTQGVRKLLGGKYAAMRLADWLARVLRRPRRPGKGIAVTF